MNRYIIKTFMRAVNEKGVKKFQVKLNYPKIIMVTDNNAVEHFSKWSCLTKTDKCGAAVNLDVKDCIENAKGQL